MGGMKTCFRCKKTKPLEDFYRHPMMADGHLGKCKECTKTDVSQNYHKRRDQYVAYERARYLRPERKKKAALYLKRRRKIHPDKAKAYRAVSYAIRRGKMERLSCEVCGAKAQAHHDDYSKPLDVRWLCFKHHREHHGQIVT